MKKIIIIITLISLISLSIVVNSKIILKKNYLNFLNLITFKFNKQDILDYKIDFVSLYIKSLSKNNYFIKKEIPVNSVTNVDNIAYLDEPTVYIYQTHANEEYSFFKNDLYNIVPTVKTASYVLSDELSKLGIKSLVEKENTISILNERGLNYSSSYKISRELLEKRHEENKSLKYFLDIHRDSVKRNVTTTTINGVTYARIMFLLGLENNNYLENKKILEKLNNYLEVNYPGLSRGIYEKKGKGVNGIYNQDYSKNVILIEVGGVDNTILEVSNSIKVIASMIYNLDQEYDKS